MSPLTILSLASLVLSFILLTPTHALYQDQAGVLDFHIPVIGALNRVFSLPKTDSRQETRVAVLLNDLVVTSETNILARIDKNGGIYWRQQLKDEILDAELLSFGSTSGIHNAKQPAVVVLTKLCLKAFNPKSGFLKWENCVSDTTANTLLSFKLSEHGVILLNTQSLSMISLESGKVISTTELSEKPLLLSLDSDQSRVQVFTTTGNILSFDLMGKQQVEESRHIGIRPESAIQCGPLFAFSSQKTVTVIHASNTKITKTLDTSADLKMKCLDNFVLAAGKHHLRFDQQSKTIVDITTAPANAHVVGASSELKNVCYINSNSKHKVTCTNLDTSSSIPSDLSVALSSYGPIERVFILDSAAWRAIIVTEDGTWHSVNLSSGEVIHSSNDALYDTAVNCWSELPLSSYAPNHTQLEYTRSYVGFEDTYSSKGPLQRFFGRWSRHASGFLEKIQQFITNPSSLVDTVANVLLEKEQEDILKRDSFNTNQLVLFGTTRGMLLAMPSRPATNDQSQILWKRWLGSESIMHIENVREGRRGGVVLVVSTNKKTNQNVVRFIDVMTGDDFVPSDKELAKHFKGLKMPGRLVSVVPTSASMSQEKLRVTALVDQENKITITPSTEHVLEHFNSSTDQIYTWYQVDDKTLKGQLVSSARRGVKVSAAWNLTFNQEHILSIASQSCPSIANIGRVLSDRNVLYKYLNRNLISVVTTCDQPDSETELPMTYVYLIDTVSGNILWRGVYPGFGASEAANVKMIMCENWIIVSGWSSPSPSTTEVDLLVEPASKLVDESETGNDKSKLKKRKKKKNKQKAEDSEEKVVQKHKIKTPEAPGYELVSIELFESREPNGRLPMGESFSSFTKHSPFVLTQSFMFPYEITSLGVTNTRSGITTREVLFTLGNNQVYGMKRQFVDPRRPLTSPTDHEKEEGTPQYAPLLPYNPKWVLSYSLPLLNSQPRISSTQTGLESTSLVLVYGKGDIFLTRRTPSGTFDLLSESFSKFGLVTTMLAVFVGIIVTKRMVATKKLKEAWK